MWKSAEDKILPGTWNTALEGKGVPKAVAANP